MAKPVATLAIEVVYATPEAQVLIALTVPEKTTVLEAIEQSGILVRCPSATLALSASKIGIFGVPVLKETPLKAGDRIELYRDLAEDPKMLRRRKAMALKREKAKAFDLKKLKKRQMKQSTKHSFKSKT